MKDSRNSKRYTLPCKHLRFSCSIARQTQKGPARFGGAIPISSIQRDYTLKLDPQPQVDFTWGLSNLNPAASSVST
jgi:hypothetical protein